MLGLVRRREQLHAPLHVEARFSDQPKTATTRPGSGRPAAGDVESQRHAVQREHGEGFHVFNVHPKLQCRGRVLASSSTSRTEAAEACNQSNAQLSWLPHSRHGCRSLSKGRTAFGNL